MVMMMQVRANEVRIFSSMRWGLHFKTSRSLRNGNRSLGLRSPCLVDEIRVNRFGIGTGKHVVPLSHPFCAISPVKHDLVKHLVSCARETPQIGQQAIAEHVASRAKAIVEHFTRGD